MATVGSLRPANLGRCLQANATIEPSVRRGETALNCAPVAPGQDGLYVILPCWKGRDWWLPSHLPEYDQLATQSCWHRPFDNVRRAELYDNYNFLDLQFRINERPREHPNTRMYASCPSWRCRVHARLQPTDSHKCPSTVLVQIPLRVQCTVSRFVGFS
jgi:hypothetical protein